MDRLLLLCVVIAVTPASFLLVLVILIGLGSDPLSIGSVADWVSSLATIFATIVALKALNSWKLEKRLSHDSKIIEKLNQLKKDTQDYSLVVNYIRIEHYQKNLPSFPERTHILSTPYWERYISINAQATAIDELLKEEIFPLKESLNIDSSLLVELCRLLGECTLSLDRYINEYDANKEHWPKNIAIINPGEIHSLYNVEDSSLDGKIVSDIDSEIRKIKRYLSSRY